MLFFLVYSFAAAVVFFNASSYVATEGQPATLCMQTATGAPETTITILLTTAEFTGVDNYY